jgi:Uma2 family endonuclease
VQFRDGSLKRPDVSIFCREPADEEEAITLLPEAVIEVISKGYEAKDLEIGPRFYLSQGVKDVVVFDPYTLVVLHIRADGVQRLVSPVDISLECGCTCTV